MGYGEPCIQTTPVWLSIMGYAVLGDDIRHFDLLGDLRRSPGSTEVRVKAAVRTGRSN